MVVNKETRQNLRL